MKKNILFITDNFPPETNAPASRTYEHCTQWVNQGYKVKVITCHPNFPFGEVYQGYQNKLYSKSYIDGIEVIRLWSFIRPNSGFIMRALDHFSFAITSSIYSILFVKTDRIITTSPQFFVNFTGLFYKLIRRVPWILELRDIWPESLKAVGSLNDGFIYRSLERLEKIFYTYSSQIIVVTNSFKKDLTDKGIDQKKIDVVRNGVSIEFFNKENIVSTHSFPKNKTVLGYVGTHGMAHNLDFFIEAANKLDNKYHFVFIGSGANKEKLISSAKTKDLDNITFYENVPKREIPSILNQLDFALVHLKPDPTFLNVIPSKIFEICAMQIPILNGVQGETASLVLENHIGENYDPKSINSFIKTLKDLQNNQSKILSIKEAQLRFAKKNSREKRASQMLEYMSNIR